MAPATVQNKYERTIQIYSWYKTARLNVLYYGESLKHWTLAVKTHDILIALSGATSPIAFWQRSAHPIYQQGWFYLTLLAALSGVLKPTLRWENNLRLFAELHTHYSDLAMELKCLCEDITASSDLTTRTNIAFEHCRSKFKELERKEPPPNRKKVRRLEEQVNSEIDINKCWFPPAE